jgi:MoxR-like ATPase
MALLITGPQGAGKTTVARLVAQRFERGVHVEGDAFLRFVVTGRETMTPDASPEALSQLRLRYALSVQTAREYERAGFEVVVEDVVAGPMLAEVAEAYERLVVLLPDEDTLAARAGSRHAPWVYRLFVDETPRLGEWMDCGHLTPEQTAAAILRA